MTKPTKTHFNPLLIAILLLAGLAFVAYILFVSPRAIAETAQPFDHSNCQYPFRESNPPDGCDNSDPADPLTVTKGGSETSGVQTQLQPETLMSQNNITEKGTPICAQ